MVEISYRFFVPFTKMLEKLFIRWLSFYSKSWKGFGTRRNSALSIIMTSFEVFLRWLGTVVTSHTASNRQAYTPVMSMLQKAVQSTHCTSCNQPAHTNVIMLYAVKCSLYVVGPFLCRTLHKSWSTGGKNVTKLLGVPKRTRWHMNFFRLSLSIVHKLSWDKKLQKL